MFDLILAIIGLVLSIFYSSSEIALISANPLQIQVWAKQRKKLGEITQSIMESQEQYLTVILIGTNLANILTTSFATVYILKLNILPHSLIVIPIAIIILLFGEILPKSVIRGFSNFGLMSLSPFLYISNIIFAPVVWLIKSVGWLDISGRLSTAEQLAEKRDDLQHMYEQVDDSDAMEKDQQEMISKLFDYSQSTVYEAMTPRTEISAVSIDAKLEDVLHTFIDSGHSKLPVYRKNLDNIIGVVFLYDLFTSPEKLQDVIKDVLHVPATKSVMEVMAEFKTAHHALAIVLDEHGGTSGIITAEDIFEELFGEFEDEFDDEYADSIEQEDGSILASAKIDWEDFNSKHGPLIPDGDYETVGGFIISEIGRIPNKNERLFLTIGQVVILKSTARRIEQIQIYPK
jgi:CBS domain containing-hemolysin-like protein